MNNKVSFSIKEDQQGDRDIEQKDGINSKHLALR